MNHENRRVEFAILFKFVGHFKGSLAHMSHNGGDIVSLARKEGSFVVRFDVTDGNHMVVAAKPFVVFVSCRHDELLKGVMGKAKHVSEVHDLGRIGLSELNADLGLEF
jgi:hypothetical protein